MHGRCQREGKESSPSSENGISWHMHSAVIASDSNSFFKDGRRISLGDCALFKPPQDCAPFIGLICSLPSSKENILKLQVNWIYRPSEIKLGKGSLLDSAPNEIFYSFHKDEIPAASLLHPCKVAFLPKGVELPKGTYSFVCRRVYDIVNKCLWWLTDKDYIHGRQEEVEQLLYKTRTEMHATCQPGGRSPKQVNGPTSASQMKTGSDNAQNTGTSQVRGKKRERSDHGGADSLRRERSSRTDDASSALYKTESNIKTEISRISGKGVIDLEGVDKLVQLMQQDKMERKMDFSTRSMLANVIASIDKVECLNRFVQLRGLTVLDDWLQEIHQGKNGDGGSAKYGDKSLEEFLLVLLRALDKLPVNLQALQMCNIGRSVNHLRSHKNTEIQRKARALVDTWKKRVEAEMISIDAKSSSNQPVVSWPSKSRLPEASHVIRTQSGSDVAMKSVVTQNLPAKTSLRSSHGENSIKQETSCGSVKQASSPSSGKENQLRTSVSVSAGAVQNREDRSSSSIQSHNNNQSPSPRDDQKSSSSGLAINRTSNHGTRSKKSSIVSESGSQKETSSCKSSAHKGSAVEKLPQSSLISEEVLDGSAGEGNGHKLAVRISSRVRSPAQVGGGSHDDPTFTNSQVSSPMQLDKHEQPDRASLEMIDSNRCNVLSDLNTLQNNEQKVVLAGSEGVGARAVPQHEDQSMTIEVQKKITRGTLKNKVEQVKLHSSFSPMNALIESCAKYAETSSSLSIEDDVGMNLLASVAAGEMSRSDMVTPTDSMERNSPAVDQVCASDEAKSKGLQDEYGAGVKNQPSNGAECNGKNQAVLDGFSRYVDGFDLSKHVTPEASGDRRNVLPETNEELPPTGADDLCSSKMDLSSNVVTKSEISEQPKANTVATSVALTVCMEKVRDGESNEQSSDEKAVSSSVTVEGVSNCISARGDDLVDMSRFLHGVSTRLDQGNGDKILEDRLDSKIKSDEEVPIVKLPTSAFKFESKEKASDEKLLHQIEQKPTLQADGKILKGESDDNDDKSRLSKPEKLDFDTEMAGNAAGDHKDASGLCSTSDDPKSHCGEAIPKSMEIQERTSLLQSRTPGSLEPKIVKDAGLTVSKSVSVHPDEAGLTADDGKYEELVTSTSPASETVHATNLLPFSQNSLRSGLSSSITVAAAAKGPFVLHDDMMKSKVEFGWKGSAATSAFRPAEPRKTIESPLGSGNVACPEASSTNKHGRVPLDFDLNVPDERVLEEIASRGSNVAVDMSSKSSIQNEASNTMTVHSFGGLDLDLNRADETYGNGHCLTSSNCKGEGPSAHVEPFGLLPSGDTCRNFDLNNGPMVDDINGEHFSINQLVKGGIVSPLPSAGPRMNAPVIGSISSWFPPGDTYSTVAVPSILPDRGEHPVPVFPTSAPPRTFGPGSVAPFSPDVLRGSVLSSSPAVPFHSSPYQLPIFPFGTPFPFPSATFSVGTTSYASDSSSNARMFAPPVNSQFLGPFSSAASQFQRPYVVSLPDNGGLENSRKWDRQGLDLNAGPGGMENKIKGEMRPLSSGQRSVSSSQALAEEQARIFPISGNTISKRKDPEGGWDNEALRHKQSSWQ
ncbi:uncharacterized protein LOC127241587 isoform X2 [Andrographis paniculata]|uniref:uncharacterized protein LOC127241587 isoform X2 n=1 Tax=Andrographis paniculata TaxID=175694 RepID=UPI0021E83F76|nr:uncharacterized protein LOC127241587 isoform X2 [Andrographis paniculata]